MKPDMLNRLGLPDVGRREVLSGVVECAGMSMQLTGQEVGGLSGVVADGDCPLPLVRQCLPIAAPNENSRLLRSMSAIVLLALGSPGAHGNEFRDIDERSHCVQHAVAI